jgi:small subunit ribosomal protein S3
VGTKTNAVGLRVGHTKNWKSSWYAEGDEYVKNLDEDNKIRSYLQKEIKDARVGRVEIRRVSDKLIVLVFVAKPGVVIGRHGSRIEKIKNKLEKMVGKPMDLRIKEIKKAQLNARIVGTIIAEGIEARQSPKMLVEKQMKKVMQEGAKGIQVWVAGRIRGHPDSRTLKYERGSVPLQTIRADIDFARVAAQYPGAGLIGVKVWINRGLK